VAFDNNVISSYHRHVMSMSVIVTETMLKFLIGLKMAAFLSNGFKPIKYRDLHPLNMGDESRLIYICKSDSYVQVGYHAEIFTFLILIK
jgi:hypothetical protein